MGYNKLTAKLGQDTLTVWEMTYTALPMILQSMIRFDKIKISTLVCLLVVTNPVEQNLLKHTQQVCHGSTKNPLET